MSQKNTVYQKLSNIFGNGAKPIVPQQNTKILNGGREILRTTSADEANIAKLQAMQDKYIHQQWHSSTANSVYKSLNYEPTRLASYTDFEQMEYFPEIASALETYVEEATVSKKGKILNIHSESGRIKAILEELFYDRLKIQSVLPLWTRTTAKYGDNIVMFNMQSNKGIIDCKQVPIYEIERHDGDFMSIIRGDYSSNATRTKFIWREQNLVLNEWQVAHFRMLGDDRKLPYGTSILEKCRRIFKQLTLAEDSMLVYRVTRAPERRVYKIYVGNIDNKDVPAYVNEIANRFKRAPIMDSTTGNYDLRYNQAGNDQDFFIPVRDENAPNPIETLPGASNLDAIADIEYLQNKLCVALRVPKTFIGFSESVGEGKNLSLMDIRFSRSVNRLQQAMIQELNKIAIIHLYLLGFSEDLNNFSLTMNNPSSAAEMLDVDQTVIKADAFIKLVSDAGDGFKIMSRTRALKEIFHWSDEEIRQDLLEQRLEKAAAAELEGTAKVIKYTGIFDKVDRIYGDINVAKQGQGTGEGDSEGGSSGGGGGFGGGGFGGGGDFEELGDEDFDDMDGAENDFEEFDDAVEGTDMDGGDATEDTLNERIINKPRRIIKETIQRVNKANRLAPQKNNFNMLIEGYNKPKSINSKAIINNVTESLINDLDDILNQFK